MERKMYKHNGANIFLEKKQYAKPKRLAVQAYVVEQDEYIEEVAFPYATITVNLPNARLSDENCAFVDTNNVPFIDEWLEENGIAEPTGRFGFSGYCCYPEMRFV